MTTSSNKTLSLNIPDTDKKRVVIIGGGFAGIRLLRHLDEERFQTVLIDRRNYHTFQPLLYQAATAGLEPDSISGPLRKVIKKRKDTFFRMLNVTRIEPDQQRLHTAAGMLEYDLLVIATGAQTNYFGNDDMREHAFPLKAVPHAMDLRSYLFEQFEKAELVKDPDERKRLMTFVIVGAGPTGVELAGALAELRSRILPKDYPELPIDRMEIHLVEGMERVLPAMSETSGIKAQQALEKMGVHIVLNHMTEQYDGTTLKLDDGTAFETDTVIWAAGVTGNLIDGLPKESVNKGRIRTDRFNRVLRGTDDETVFDGLFAVGDVAGMEHPDYPGGLPGLAQPAIQQGKQLAANLNRLDTGQPLKAFRYRNKGVMATIGRNKAVADLPGGLHPSGFIGWAMWMAVHLAFLIGFRNRAVVLANWAWNYFTYDRGIRLILRPSIRKETAPADEVVEEIGDVKPGQSA